MSNIGLESFTGSRCRIARLSDGKTFNGWVEQFDGRRLAVVSESLFDLRLGVAIYAELFGEHITACMAVDITACGPAHGTSDRHCNMEWLQCLATAERMEGDVTSKIRVIESTDSRRRVVQDWHVEIICSGERICGTVHDVSAGGLGVDVDGVIEAGTEVELRVYTPEGEVQCEAQVKYCRELQGASGLYRCGIRVDNLGRIDYARWAKATQRAA